MPWQRHFYRELQGTCMTHARYMKTHFEMKRNIWLQCSLKFSVHANMFSNIIKKKKPIYFACFHKRETTFFFWITKLFAQNQWDSLAWFWLIYVLKGRCERDHDSALSKQKSCYIQKQPLEVLYKNLTNFTGKHLCQSLFFSLQLY